MRNFYKMSFKNEEIEKKVFFIRMNVVLKLLSKQINLNVKNVIFTNSYETFFFA